jgi:hypothetical protein
MPYKISNPNILKKILWLDALAGGTTAIFGLILSQAISHLFGIAHHLFFIIVSITLVYAIVAFYLAIQKIIPVTLLRILVYANWVWTIISVFLLYFHFRTATTLGLLFLVLQIIVVGGLAYFEGRQIVQQ